ncbi:hypothetical protein [Lacinutrix undariae]
METELIVVLVASLATLIVALINVIVSKGISSKQNAIGLKKTRIDLLENRRLTIEKVGSELKQISLNVKPSDIYNLAISGPIMIEYFRVKSSLFLSIGHFFKEEISLELESLRKEIDDNIMKTANLQPITNDDAKNVIDGISTLDKKIQKEISTKLREIEKNIEDLLI